MKTVLKSSIFKDHVLIKTFEKDFESSNYQENIIEIKNESEEGTITEIQLDGVRLILRDIKTNNYTINVFHDFPLFKLQFEIEGSSLYTPINKLSKTVYIPSGHYNLFYLPEVEGILNYKTNYRKTLEIVFTEKYIKKIFGPDFKKTLKQFGKAIDKKQPFLMWKKSKPISLKLNNYIQEIIECEYSGNFKKAFLETKINELLIVLLAKTNEIEVNIPEDDYLNIIKVEVYIKNNLKTNHTISELALIAGMNTTKLKQNFKVVFSSTIFKYTTTLRMEKAKKLIIEKQYTVAEVAYKVGYKHPQHFTVAFKKLYGYLPSELILKQ